MAEILNTLFQRGFGKTLAENERLIFERKIHWGICFPALGILLLGFYISLKSRAYSLLDFLPQQLLSHLPQKVSTIIQDNLAGFFINPMKWLSYLVLIYGCWRLYKAIITYMTTFIYSTQHRLFIQTGLVKNQQVEILWDQVDTFQITKGEFGKFLNYGTLTIHTVGGMTTHIPAVQDPDNVHLEVVNLRFNKA